jgi:predicted Zn-dependent protease
MSIQNWLAALSAGALLLASGAATAEPASEAERSYLQRDFLIVTSSEIESYLQSVAAKLLRTRFTSSAVPHIIVYSGTDFNAMADASKNLVISTEVLQQIESEDELAALLGHELTHVQLGHPEKKTLLGKFPMSIDMMGEAVALTRVANTNKKNRFAKDSLSTSQKVSLFWSDLLMPNWNREDEREADRVSYDMMRAAGYDPDAFATLFQRLHAAQLKRSERMEELRKSMIKRAQDRQRPCSSTESLQVALCQANHEALAMASEKAINTLFDEIAQMGKNYDSPEQRQDLLNQYAAKLPPLDDDKKPRSALFEKTLHAGAGGALLSADQAALAAVTAMEAGDLAAAAKSIKILLQPAASPHLNFAIGKWMLENDKQDVAEDYAKQWLDSSRAPAKAFLWRAGHQAEREEFTAANATLKDAGQRIGSPAPFLSQEVTYARVAGDIPQAQQLTTDCRKEDQSHKQMLTRTLDWFRDNPPTALYAACLANLGMALPDNGESKWKHLVQATGRAVAGAVK